MQFSHTHVVHTFTHASAHVEVCTENHTSLRSFFSQKTHTHLQAHVHPCIDAHTIVRVHVDTSKLFALFTH